MINNFLIKGFSIFFNVYVVSIKEKYFGFCFSGIIFVKIICFIVIIFLLLIFCIDFFVKKIVKFFVIGVYRMVLRVKNKIEKMSIFFLLKMFDKVVMKGWYMV